MRRLRLLLAVLLLAPAAQAWAQDDQLRRGIDPVTNKLSPAVDAFLTSDGGRTSPAGSYKLELAADYVSGVMSLKAGDQKLDDLLQHRFDLHLLGAYAITDWAEVGGDLPFTAYQQSNFAALYEATGFQDRAPEAYGLGDLRLFGKFRVLREDLHYVTVSALAELRVPTGADASFLGERSVVVVPRVLLERSFLPALRVGLDVGYRYRALAGRYLNLYVGDELELALAGSYDLPRVFDRAWAVSAEILYATPARAPFGTASTDALKSPFEALLGLKVQLWGPFWAQVGGGTGFLGESGFGREAFRLFAMVGYSRIWRDRDGDGIPDDEDRCPDEREDKDGFEDSDGCPDPDNDGDGIPDREDQCPDVPGTKVLHGCPDADGDGIGDAQDRCPKDPGPAEYDGCPDKDGDEIPDIDDKCPTESGPPELEGCPGPRPWVVYEGGKLSLRDSVHFDTGKATIKKSSLVILDELAAVLGAHAEIKRLRIDGHTDSVGGAVMNLDLSQRRAQSVVDYLVSKGIEQERLSAKGFGLERPIATNKTPLGRAKNRRVECSILE